jgi:hypothetical protein
MRPRSWSFSTRYREPYRLNKFVHEIAWKVVDRQPSREETRIVTLRVGSAAPPTPARVTGKTLVSVTRGAVPNRAWPTGESSTLDEKHHSQISINPRIVVSGETNSHRSHSDVHRRRPVSSYKLSTCLP